MPNQNSEFIRINDYKGKYVLVDFWASWCGPCRKKYPKYLDFYSKTNKEKFNIIGVSIDDNEEDWKNAIKQDSLIWENVIDKNSKISDELGVLAVPQSYLLDQKGKIVGINLTIDEIKKIIAK